MPRRIRYPTLPLTQLPRTRTNVRRRLLTLDALPANGRPILPPPPPAPPRALTTPPRSSIWSDGTLDIGPPAYGNHHRPAHIEHIFRGRTELILRTDWEDPVFMAALRAREDAVRAGDRRERLRRQREGGRGRRARRAAFRRGGGGGRLRVRGRFASVVGWWLAE